MNTKTHRPTLFKLDAYRLYIGGQSAKDAFEASAKIHDVPLSGAMTDYAPSYMSGDVKGTIRKLIKAENRLVLEYFQYYKLSLEV